MSDYPSSTIDSRRAGGRIRQRYTSSGFRVVRHGSFWVLMMVLSGTWNSFAMARNIRTGRALIDATPAPTNYATPAPTTSPETPVPTVATSAPTSPKFTPSPTGSPSSSVTPVPTGLPSMGTTEPPSVVNTPGPTGQPTSNPSTEVTTDPTVRSTPAPTSATTAGPTSAPSMKVTADPTARVTPAPTDAPVMAVTADPTARNTPAPTEAPSVSKQTNTPSPSAETSHRTTATPTGVPSVVSSALPTGLSSQGPTRHPSVKPSPVPTEVASSVPTGLSSPGPTGHPPVMPSPAPTEVAPSVFPTGLGSPGPTGHSPVMSSPVPSEVPTQRLTLTPTVKLTWVSVEDSTEPSEGPSPGLTLRPAVVETTWPTWRPSASYVPGPTGMPSMGPTPESTGQPTVVPSETSLVPSVEITTEGPTERPSKLPTTASPTHFSLTTTFPSLLPSVKVSSVSTVSPTTTIPTVVPTVAPVVSPTPRPTNPFWVGTTPAPTSPTAAPTENDIRTLTLGPQVPTIGWGDDDDFYEFPETPAPQAPSDRPSISGTPEPSIDIGLNEVPSLSLTARPATASPTVPPTRRPTPNPTNSPTAQPTGTPTKEPTKIPSPGPTTSPTDLPTDTPTQSPTKSPTNGPTPAPTLSPTSSPTPNPTPTGTFEPTTVPPTLGPTVTLVPSASPSTSPTRSPTSLPSGSPTASPSLAPTLTQVVSIVPLLMHLSPYEGDSILDSVGTVAWQKAFEKHLRLHIGSSDTVPLTDLSVRTNIKKQEIPESSHDEDPGGGPGTASLVIQVDVVVEYSSVGTIENIERLVLGAWDEPAKEDEFIKQLRLESSVFNGVQEVSVEVEGYIPRDDDDDDSSNIAVIAGASVGGLAFALLVGFLFVRRSSEDSVDEKHAQSQQTPNETTATKTIAVSTEILVEPQDDISTLGDPMFAPGGMLMGGMEKDEVTASVGDDYDYAKQYRQGQTPSLSDRTPDRSRIMSEDFTKTSSANSTTMSKLGRMSDSLFADDASFEQQFAEPEERFDVVAPAGKLGMVIDTPNGGQPVVHAIKDTSVLADRVRVGDRLMSVDGEDCTAMTAMHVSKLISLKSEKPARVLVFARTQAATEER